jgi:hypothetical protein
MRKPLWIILTAVLVAIGVPNARADQVDTFTITGTGITGSGTITLMTTGTPGVDEITGITGNFSTTNNGGFSGSITGLNPGSYNASSPTVEPLSTYDNLFYTSGSTLPCLGSGPAGGVLDFCGLDFLVAGGYEVNVFGVPGGSGYLVSDGKAGGTSYIDFEAPATFVATPAPEPSSVALLLTALLAMAFMGRKRIVQGLQKTS